METLDIFYNYNGAGIFYQNFPEEKLSKYQNVLPQFLIETLKVNGLSHFNDGFFWLTNPEEYAKLLALFFPNKGNLYVIIRNAFGGMIYLDHNDRENAISNKKYNYLCPIRNQNIALSDNLLAVMNGWLTTEEIYAPLMFTHIYKSTRKLLRIISKDECYGFVPALALGGDTFPENVNILELQEHLTFLSAL